MKDQSKIRVGRLRSVGEIVHELGRLYRQTRRGEVPSNEAFRMASILGIMRQCLESSDAEGRIAQLEAQLSKTGKVLELKAVNG